MTVITSPGPDGWLALAKDQLKYGHRREAESVLFQGVRLFPQYADNWQLLAQLSVNLNKHSQGLFAAWQANSLAESVEMQAVFAHCLSHVAITAHDPQLQSAVARAVAETWGPPAELAEQAWRVATDAYAPGPVHLNLAFREPLSSPIDIRPIGHHTSNALINPEPAITVQLNRGPRTIVIAGADAGPRAAARRRCAAGERRGGDEAADRRAQQQFGAPGRILAGRPGGDRGHADL